MGNLSHASSVDPWTLASQSAVGSRAQVAEQLHANSDSDADPCRRVHIANPIRNKQLPLSNPQDMIIDYTYKQIYHHIQVAS